MQNSRRTSCAILGCLAIILVIAAGRLKAEGTISVYADNKNRRTLFALQELKSVLSQRGHAVKSAVIAEADIVLFPATSAATLQNMRQSLGSYDFELRPEGFSIRKGPGKKIWVAGADDAGLMYGGLELAEQIKLYGVDGIQEVDQNPYMEKRGIKFNIPLDVRTPSYTDMSDAAQQNIPEMWSLDFWKATIDRLAKYRYNVISLWSLHPFPSLVEVPDYPQVALDDVKRSTAKFSEYYSTRATGFDAPEILQHLQTVKQISMREKIKFWKEVMRYGKDRNIDFYVMTWNLYTYGIEGKYGITDDMENKTTRDYFRRSVKQLFVTYPELAGIGLTTGENMGKGGEGFEAKEDWAFDTYAQGVLDVVNEQSNRKIVFIHRQHESAANYIAKKFAPVVGNSNIEFLYSYKYAKAHVFSSARQSFHRDFVEEIKGTKTLWTLRNDDNYHFRWGAPDFVREFMKNIPADVSRGFYYGSDGHIWGREFLSKEPETPRQLEIDKHWYHWMLWGRLGFNPDVTDDRFVSLLQVRFPEIDAARLFTAWQEASMIYPTTTGFHWGALDYQWYIEGCKSRPEPAQTASGFHDVNRFITLPPHRETGFQSIPDFVKMTVAKTSSGLVSPLAVAQRLHDHADKALKTLEAINPAGNKELSNTVHDIRSMAYLGKYYAFKIAGATNLALYRETKDIAAQNEAVKQLTAALEYWKQYTGSAEQLYKNPLWTNRVGYVDWTKLTEEVKNDIQIAKEKN